MGSACFLHVVEDELAGGGLSPHSCLIHSLYTSRVLLHPPCPCYSQMSNLGKHGSESTMCVWLWVPPCVHLLRPSWRGWICSLFGVRLPVSDIHHGRYPAGALMHAGKCIHVHHQLWKVPHINHIYTPVTYCSPPSPNTHTHKHTHFATLCSSGPV